MHGLQDLIPFLHFFACYDGDRRLLAERAVQVGAGGDLEGVLDVADLVGSQVEG